jgi:hypothetical protein
MEWGEHHDQLQAMRAQGITVAALDRMPELPAEAVHIARAFMDLCGERSATGQLRWTAVMQWAHALGVDGFALWDALAIVDADIRKWLAHRSTSQQSQQAPRLKSTP